MPLISLDEFVALHLGGQIELTGSKEAMYQCTDLTNLYFRDVLGAPIIPWTNAQDFPSKVDKNLFDWIPNGDTNFPLKGDTIIWKSKDGIGHIATALDGCTTTKVYSFDQNWSKPLFCTKETHTYTGTNYQIIGWLHFKGVTPQDDMITDDQKRILQFLTENNANEGKVREAFGALLTDLPDKNKQIQALQARVIDLENSQKNMADRVATLEATIQANVKSLSDCQSELATANGKVSELNQTVEAITSQKNQYKGWYEAALQKTIDKYSAHELLSIGFKLLFSNKKK